MEQTIEKPLKINYIDNPTCLGDKIKNRRLFLGLTQEEAAAKIGVARNGLLDWENKNSDPTIAFYPGIIKFLEYSPFSIDTSHIGGQLKEYRFLNGLSLENLAQKLNIGSATIYRMENNKSLPNKKTVMAIKNILNSI